MRKRVICVICLLLLCLVALPARPLTNLDLNVMGAYSYSGEGDYFRGMGDASSWNIGGGLTFRFWWITLDCNLLACTSYCDDDSKLSVMPSAGLSVPLSSFSNLEFSCGPSMDFLVAKKGTCDNNFRFLKDGEEYTDADFSTMFLTSNFFWKAGFSLNIGNFSLHFAYLCPTSVSFSTVTASHAVSDYFLIDRGLLSLMVGFSLY